jgi:hypothetical protein
MLLLTSRKSTKTLPYFKISSETAIKGLTTYLSHLLFHHSYLPGSSAVEQVTVNHFVVGSIPTRAAI